MTLGQHLAVQRPHLPVPTRDLSFGLMDKLTVDFCADRHFDQVVVYIADDSCSGSKLHPLSGDNIATNNAVQNDIRGGHTPLNHAPFRNAQHRIAITISANIALDRAIDMTAAGEI